MVRRIRPQKEAIGDRVAQLVLELGLARRKRMTYREFGQLVAAAESPPRKPPYAAQTVAAWIENRGVPSITAFVAMSKVSKRIAPPGRSEAWIAFGTAIEK